MAYSRDKEGVVPVVTAVEEQDIPLSRYDLLFRAHLLATCQLFRSVVVSVAVAFVDEFRSTLLRVYEL